MLNALSIVLDCVATGASDNRDRDSWQANASGFLQQMLRKQPMDLGKLC